MQAFIVSDLHLGSSATRHGDFVTFVKTLPEGATLVLNGDIANDATKQQVCRAKGVAVLDLLCRESFHRPIVWLAGNNDTDYRPEAANRIVFEDHIVLDERLYVCHGHRFLGHWRWSQWLQRRLRPLFLLLHRDRARTMHMADYLQRIPPLYHVACRLVRRGAVRFARRNGYTAITCGHTHHAEDITVNGVRYFNTGAWTEPRPHYLLWEGKEGALRPVVTQSAPLDEEDGQRPPARCTERHIA